MGDEKEQNARILPSPPIHDISPRNPPEKSRVSKAGRTAPPLYLGTLRSEMSPTDSCVWTLHPNPGMLLWEPWNLRVRRHGRQGWVIGYIPAPPTFGSLLCFLVNQAVKTGYKHQAAPACTLLPLCRLSSGTTSVTNCSSLKLLFC